jgi:chromosome segregation protein
MSSDSSKTPVLFPNGARWVRADFHLHTLAETDSGREFRKEYRDETATTGFRWKDYLKDCFDRLDEEKIRVAVITNHNRFDYAEFKEHASEGQRRGILVLPGVELNVNSGGGLHTLIVFSDGWLEQVDGQTLINRFLTSQFPADQSIATPSKDNLPGIFKALEDFKEDYFVVFAHVQSSNGLWKELTGNTLESTISQCGEHWKKRVLGLQKVTDVNGLKQRWPQGVPLPAFVHGSDPRRMKGDESVGSGPVRQSGLQTHS